MADDLTDTLYPTDAYTNDSLFNAGTVDLSTSLGTGNEVDLGGGQNQPSTSTPSNTASKPSAFSAGLSELFHAPGQFISDLSGNVKQSLPSTGGIQIVLYLGLAVAAVFAVGFLIHEVRKA